MPPHHEATQDACSSTRMYVHPALGIDSGMGIAVAMAMAIGMACYVACCMAVWLYHSVSPHIWCDQGHDLVLYLVRFLLLALEKNGNAGDVTVGPSPRLLHTKIKLYK